MVGDGFETVATTFRAFNLRDLRSLSMDFLGRPLRFFMSVGGGVANTLISRSSIRTGWLKRLDLLKTGEHSESATDSFGIFEG